MILPTYAVSLPEAFVFKHVENVFITLGHFPGLASIHQDRQDEGLVQFNLRSPWDALGVPNLD